MRIVKFVYVIKLALNLVLLYLGTMAVIPDLIRGIYFIFPTGSVAHTSSYSMGAGVGQRDVELTTPASVVEFRTRGIYDPPPLPVPLGLRYAWLRTESPWTNSMGRNPSCEAKRPSCSYEIPRMLQNLQVNYRIHVRSPPVPLVNHINPVGASLSHFLKIIKGRGNANFIVAVSEC